MFKQYTLGCIPTHNVLITWIIQGLDSKWEVIGTISSFEVFTVLPFQPFQPFKSETCNVRPTGVRN